MPETLFSLAEQIRRCTACPLWKGRTLAVPGEGPKNAKIMVIGGATHEQEDREGLPLVGKSGTLLKKMFEEIGVDYSTLFITNSVKCHVATPKAPTLAECTTCKKLWLDQQITLLNPQLIILLGEVALRSCLGKKSLDEVHGTTIEHKSRQYFVTYHPETALHSVLIQVKMKRDFVKLKKIMFNV
ncbi:uracil-DNA glycosylase [Candidatus Woesearchaeota archaeon]|nr:uracil-DNA glycosylase [Candidatus Woesearchaeota archaeon]